MGIIQAIVYGIVQGLTEFLPISSTAHLRIIPALLGWPDPGAPFTACIQLGTLAAVLIYFSADIWAALVAWAGAFRGGDAAKTPEAKLGWAIFFGTIPIVVLGVLFKDSIENQLRSLYVVSWSLIGMALLLLLAERTATHRREMEDVQVRDGWWVGAWQAIALIPGASRSGSTITGALFGGFDRATAARFSFLLSVPSVLAAGVFALVKHKNLFMDPALRTPLIISNVLAFIVGYGSIAFLMNFLKTRTTMVFILYRLALGVTLLVLLSQGVLKPDTGAATEKDSKPNVSKKAA